MNGRKSFFVATIIVLVAAALFARWVLHDGLSARSTPSWLETFVARKSRHLSIPNGARAETSPVVNSPEVQRDARLHFADHCAVCHGNDGSGDTMMGRGMYPKPPDLRDAHTQKLSDGELFWIIENGVRFTGMPAFGGNNGGHGGQVDSWKLVLFIRHLPQLTAEERLEMEKYNPKGPEDREEEQREEDFLNENTPQPMKEMEHHHH
ncbi:MAG TPA: c-type cytochrome [Candidatus Dormibacteraeota bacterium]|jgi:mono/diheme cytochrome c family protein|nr:c-type cytochrome [Candidatus Dormibacteraeota bacterium]